MSIEMRSITVSGLPVEIVRKRIKNLHLGVYPPHGRIRVAAPLALNDDAVRLAVITRLPWIKRQRAAFERQERQSPRQYVSGETHYVFGRRCRLRVVQDSAARQQVVASSRTIVMQVRANTSSAHRERIFAAWYRGQLRSAAAPLIEKWARLLHVPAPQWGIKRMKTKWGSCSTATHRIWLNLELAKKPPQCLEYIVVHEMAHLIERHHNDRFLRLLDRHLPQWRVYRGELNAAPLRNETWPNGTGTGA